MVKNCITIYVIAFSSVLLLGRSYATTSPTPMFVTRQQSYRTSTKVNFRSHVKINASVNIAEKNITETRDKGSERLKPLEISHVFSNDSVGRINATRPYFALFDPIANITIRVEVPRLNLPPKIRYSELNDFLVAESANSGNIKQNLGKQSHFDWKENYGREKMKNFIEWDALRDSEKEVRIHFNAITAKETVVNTGAGRDIGKRLGLKLRQLTDGIHFIQLILNFDNEIQDCEYIKQKTIVEKFLRSFRNNVENAERIYEETTESNGKKDFLRKRWKHEEEEDDYDYSKDDEGKIEKYSVNDSEQYEGEDSEDSGMVYRNVTFQIIKKDEDLPEEFAEWMNYSRLKKKCRENHKILKQLAFNKRHGDEFAKKLAEEHIERVKRSSDFSLIFPGTKWCGKSHIAEKYPALGGFSKTDKCCRTHDHCHPLIPAFEKKYNVYNFRPFTVSHCRCDLRRKRDLMDVLLVPGTKWCGKGRRATKYTSLGGFSRTDKCCRVHDTLCPHWIGSLEEKYGLFNWRINTIMHCRCDKRFRACLKMAKTGTANFVGKLFFNVVQTKCFVLKPQEVCLKYSWWGKCEKKEYRKKAYLKDNLSY